MPGQARVTVSSSVGVDASTPDSATEGGTGLACSHVRDRTVTSTGTPPCHHHPPHSRASSSVQPASRRGSITRAPGA